MENKATLTYSFSESGDENLFLTLSTRLGETLSNQNVEWRRTYGRASHKFKLKVKILPLATALLERTDLVTRPYFHVFWTDCNDMDQYKATIRSEISSWVNMLKSYKDTEWMIIVVAGDILSRLTKAKLPLPRMSIPDKVKADFCSKSPERLHILHDPTKETTKSVESWASLGLKVANQTVRCMEVVVSKYEERVRAERERRNEKSWDFCSYLILQEELAFMYEMLGMYSPALVQYDELDAMFTQYVLNANAGDIAHWLSRFSEPIRHWHSLLLWKRIDNEARRTIMDGQASIIDIRNYLFTRLCHLLFEMGKVSEVTQRMHFFLHSISTEIGILEISVPEGAIDCWVFMCCLELVGALRRKSKLQNDCETNSSEQNCDMDTEQLVLENASLWNMARLKLYSLGELCGLIPEMVITSSHLQIVVDLLAGMGEGEERGDLATAPALVLREALSSQSHFQRHYFELSELAMGTFKHMGHYRAVRCIGNDLAEFYLKLGEPAQAENYLIDTVKMYAKDGWPLLHAKANKMLARCYKKMINIRKYLRLCYSLMCDMVVTEAERIFYCDEFKSLSTDLGDESLALNIHPIASVTSIKFVPAETSLRQHSKHHLVVSIKSNAPKPITFQSMQISLDHLGPDDGIEPNPVPDSVSLSSFFSKTSEDDPASRSLLSGTFSHNDSYRDSLRSTKRHKRFASTASSREFMSNQLAELDHNGKVYLYDFYPQEQQNSKNKTFPLKMSLHSQRDLQNDGTLAWAGITCRHANDLLRRQDSSQSQFGKQTATTSVTLETYECCLEVKQVTLNPGLNDVKLQLKTDIEGMLTLQQLRLCLHKTCFVLPRIQPIITYQVSYVQPRIFIEQDGSLTSGIVQHFNVIINKGDFVAPENDGKYSTIQLKTQENIKILKVTKCSLATPDGEISELSKPSLLTSSGESNMELPEISCHATLLLKLACLCLAPPFVQTLDFHRTHRRTHSAPPATYSRSPKSTPRHKSIVESPPDPKPPSVTSSSSFTSQDVDATEPAPVNGDDVISISSSTGDVKQSRLSDLRDSINRSRNNLRNKFIRGKSQKNTKPHFDDWPKVPAQQPDVIITPSLRINGDLIEVTLDDNDVTMPSTPRSSSPSVTRKETLSMTSCPDMTSSSSDEEDSVPVVLRKSLSTRHAPSKSDAAINHTLPPATSSTSKSSGESSHEVTIATALGEETSVTSSIVCRRPLDFSCSWSFAGSDVIDRILTVAVENVTSSAMTLCEPKLTLSNIKSFRSLNGTRRRPLRALGSSTFAWVLTSHPFNSLTTSAQFQVDLVSRVDDVDDEVTSTVTYRFEVENQRPIYAISCSVDQTQELRNGVMTSLRIDVTRLRDDPEHETTSNGQQLLMFQVVDTRGRWAVFGKSSGIMSMPASRVGETTQDAVHVATATVEVMPLVSGSLHMPYVLLHRFMKRRSSEFDEQLSSTQSPVLKPPRLRDFQQGQVFYRHIAHQVQVLPPKDDVKPDVTEL